jgi:hypothetical protein
VTLATVPVAIAATRPGTREADEAEAPKASAPKALAPSELREQPLGAEIGHATPLAVAALRLAFKEVSLVISEEPNAALPKALAPNI